MMWEYPTYGEACTIGITLNSPSKSEFGLRITDMDNDTVVYTNRTGLFKGEETYYVPLPIAPDIALIEVVSKDNMVDIGFIETLPLKTDYNADYFDNPNTQEFIKFAEEFAYLSPTLDAGGTRYYSDDEQYTIILLDDIITDGQPDSTPARISRMNGVIEVSKALFDDYSVPMRIAILLHEYAHYYLNRDMKDELEADYHSLKIYIALGYPRIDAYNVYLDVFENTPTELNKERYQQLNELFNVNYEA
jgi:hypothetical protein